MMERIDIDKLVIRFRSVDSEIARQVVDGLGSHLLRTIAAQDRRKSSEVLQVQKMDLGVLRTSQNPSPAGLRRQISRAVSGAVQAKQMNGKGE